MEPKPLARARAQSSIRSFFQPRQPNYATPPSATTSSVNGVVKTAPTISISPLQSSTPPQPHTEPEINPLVTKSGSRPQASISPIREKHVQQLKRINALLLPINYPDSFYNKIVDPKNSPNFSRVILWHDPLTLKSVFSTSLDPKVVGGIVCRLDRDESTKTCAIYIQSLALLSPYRSHGLATRVLDDIIRGLVNIPANEFPVTSLYAHVWTENNEAMEWYSARGFTREEPVVEGYYRRLQPGNAWIMRRPLAPSDHLRHSCKRNNPATSENSSQISPPPSAASDSALIPSTSSAAQDPPTSTPFRPALIARAASYQTTGPGHEWNDLPNDIISSKSKPQTPEPPIRGSSGSHLIQNSATGSAASSRSSSSTRNGGKKKRQYPAAAFNATANGTGNS